MERRYQVFVSSTYTDLADERAEVVSMLLNLDALPAGMELFPATNDDAWTLIKRVIDESDYYLLVIGGRYGSVDDETQLSYTEKEFDYAVDQKKPVMAFVHGDPGKIVVEKTDGNDAARAKLDAFRSKVEGAVHVNYWTSRAELSGLVAKSFVKIQKSHPATGWVRGDVKASTEAIEEINTLRNRLEETQRRLVVARDEPPEGTEDFAQASDLVALRVVLRDSRWEYDTRKTATVAVTGSWDELLAEIGAMMIDESSENRLRQRLDQWATARAPTTDVAFEVLGGSLVDRDFDTVLLQLRALGLTAKSERSRSVKDTATYWTLTPYGDSRLTTLRALRKGEMLADSDEGET